jgi:hypothetical protein
MKKETRRPSVQANVRFKRKGKTMENIISRNGLLYKQLDTLDADYEARKRGFAYAEQLVESLLPKDDVLWRLRDIREDLMSHGLGGRCYNCDEWSTPVVNLDKVIKILESNAENHQQGEV